MHRLLLLGLFLLACNNPEPVEKVDIPEPTDFSLLVLGVAQDGGYPHVGCERQCCQKYWDGQQAQRTPTCLALHDRRSGKVWMFEATPEYTDQWERLRKAAGLADQNVPDGIFLTHAHIGHYTGLMFLGREALGAKEVPVYAMRRMRKFLESNGPWSQLVKLKNIDIKRLRNDVAVALADDIRVIPFRVPHRDEFSETVGYRLAVAGKQILFIPDIDKWEKWDRKIIEEIKSVDMAYLDATFYKNGELKRDMSEIPHPFMEESMQMFDSLSVEDKAKVHFIHFNHTNPMLWDTAEIRAVEARGFNVAREGESIAL